MGWEGFVPLEAIHTVLSPAPPWVRRPVSALKQGWELTEATPLTLQFKAEDACSPPPAWPCFIRLP